MKLITSNDQLCAILPNIMTVVKGERPVIDKIVPFIDAAEKWLIDNICPKEIFDDIAARPDPSSARLRNSESGDEPAQSQQSRDEILMKLKVTMARIVAFDAFRSAIPHLDIILTPNGFGIVNNSNIAPASKERVERLINSLLDNRDNEIESLLSLLPKETGWTSSDQGRFFSSTMFPNIDVTTRLPKVSCGRWEQYLTVRETLQVMEDFFARQYLSKPLLQIFRDEVQTGTYRSPLHIHACNIFRAIEIRCLRTPDPTSTMHFEHYYLTGIVNCIKQNPDDFAEWHASETAKLYEPAIYLW